MLTFRLDPFSPLLDAIRILSYVAPKANIKSTTSTLTLSVAPPTRRFIGALQMLPEFFNFFHSDDTHQSRIPLDLLCIIMDRMELRGFSSMYFAIFQSLSNVLLTFQEGHEPNVMRELDLLPSEVENIEQIDYGTFVSIDSHDFRRVLLELNAYSVHVSVTDSRVKFSTTSEEIVFTKEERRSIIGGLREGEEVKFLITLYPWVFFHDLSYEAKRAWFFMSNDFSTVIIHFFGIYSQYWVYFP
ncbi:uncharacterized protein LOC111807006 [Cucurbita pepo subsp. pepo]|uniref:uncharacterized protein LOC111807006 n=1 Tax=Cucurbita pepo subsp. pepo TaxID=3664 RepID=UPI000C9D4A10|nr:uncharacterized protein LOC111807006 [Cucurbita pepo subsp. pepo]